MAQDLVSLSQPGRSIQLKLSFWTGNFKIRDLERCKPSPLRQFASFEI
jgi:hypothetical protein